mgnify:CR=1 FL=1
MSRTRNENGVGIQLTTVEETQRDQEEQDYADRVAAFTAAKPMRDWDKLRTERNALLASSDWTQSPDSPLGDAKADLATYRQELRDLPATTDDPANPTWPSAPE